MDWNNWIGREFKVIISFGQKAMSKYAKGIELTECILGLESQVEWIEIDNKSIKIELN